MHVKEEGDKIIVSVNNIAEMKIAEGICPTCDNPMTEELPDDLKELFKEPLLQYCKTCKCIYGTPMWPNLGSVKERKEQRERTKVSRDNTDRV